MFVQTHVCIQQTVIDLLERGFEVHVVADATSSRSQMDRLLALQASICSSIGQNLGIWHSPVNYQISPRWFTLARNAVEKVVLWYQRKPLCT